MEASAWGLRNVRPWISTPLACRSTFVELVASGKPLWLPTPMMTVWPGSASLAPASSRLFVVMVRSSVYVPAATLTVTAPEADEATSRPF